jgi:hypothetical protein
MTCGGLARDQKCTEKFPASGNFSGNFAKFPPPSSEARWGRGTAEAVEGGSTRSTAPNPPWCREKSREETKKRTSGDRRSSRRSNVQTNSLLQGISQGILQKVAHELASTRFSFLPRACIARGRWCGAPEGAPGTGPGSLPPPPRSLHSGRASRGPGGGPPPPRCARGRKVRAKSSLVQGEKQGRT